jgi:uncharacterized protein DUF559
MPPETASGVDMRRQMRSGPLDREIGGLAGRQHGVVSRAQLIQAGMSKSGIDRRIRAGRLHVLHPRVYAVGHRAVSREGRWLAAVLHGGEEAVLSHRSAAALWGVKRGGEHGRIEIGTPRSMRSYGAVYPHHTGLLPDEVTSRRRIPVTTLTRTLLDIASGISEEGLEAAIREAEYLHRFRPQQLEDLLERHPGRRGAKAIKACLRRLSHGPAGRTRSRLEIRFAALLAQTELPKPALNALLDLNGSKVEADCLWRDQRLIVELDGGKAHRTRSAFESDRERDRRLQVAGWRVIRVTWHQLDEPVALIEDLRLLLCT